MSGQWGEQKTSWTSVPRALCRVGWYSTKGSAKSCPWGGTAPATSADKGWLEGSLANIWWEGIQREPDSSRWCPLTEQMALGTKQNWWNSLWIQKVLLYCEDKLWDRFPREAVGSPSLEILKTQPWTQPGCCSGQGAGLSYPWNCLIVSVSLTWTSDKAYSTSLWKTDQNWGSVVYLLKMSSSSYPQCLSFHILGRLTLCAFCFLFCLSCCCLLEKKVVTDFQMTTGGLVKWSCLETIYCFPTG